MNRLNFEFGEAKRAFIYDCIVAYVVKTGYPPTIQELCELTGLKSKSTIYKHLHMLADRGAIEMEAGKSRTIRVPGYKFVKESE